VAWVRYSKFIAPISVWCNWFAWSPVLAIGSGLASGYILGALFPADAAINTWQVTLLDLGFIKQGLLSRISATFVLGAALLLGVFAIQHGGILRSARTTMILGITALIPLMLIALVPLLSGDLPSEHFSPLAPIAARRDRPHHRRRVEHGRHHPDGGRPVHRRLVDLRLRDRGLLHARVPRPEDRHLQGDHVFRSALHRRLHPGAARLPGHLGLGKVVTEAVVDANGAVTAPAVYDGMLAPDISQRHGRCQRHVAR
jgi:hypothetical protein